MNEHETEEGNAEHAHEKIVTIIVNTRPKAVIKQEFTFMEIVALAFDSIPTSSNITFTITYRKGPDHKKEGTLVEGESIKIKEGMIFNVTATDKS